MLGGKYEVQLPLMTLSTRTMKGCYLGSIDEMGELMDLVRAGKIDPVPVESRPASEANEALQDLKSGKIKGLVCLKH